MKQLSVVIARLVVAASVVAGPAGTRPALALTCGETITHSTTLTSDLGPCDGDGLVIGADGITLDLGGHTISAVVQPSSTVQAWTGVRVGNHHDVTVRNGNILGFTPYIRSFLQLRTAVQVGPFPFGAGSTPADNGNSNQLQQLQTDGAIDVVGDFNTISHNRAGLTLLGSHNYVVRNETPPAPLNGSDTICPSPDGLGIHVRGSFNTIKRNRACGLLLSWNSDPQDGSGNQIVSNILTGPIQIAGGSPIPPGGPSPNPDPGSAIGNMLVKRNKITTTPFANESLDPHAGIRLFDVSNSIVSKNRVTGDGIVIDQTPDRTPQQPIGPIDNNQIIGNTVLLSRANGIEVPGPQDFLGLPVSGALGTLVSRNKTHNNGENGIANGAPSSTIARNKANGNADLGIESVAGVIDGGGNRAIGNGDPLQCTNVVCN